MGQFHTTRASSRLTDQNSNPDVNQLSKMLRKRSQQLIHRSASFCFSPIQNLCSFHTHRSYLSIQKAHNSLLVFVLRSSSATFIVPYNAHHGSCFFIIVQFHRSPISSRVVPKYLQSDSSTAMWFRKPSKALSQSFKVVDFNLLKLFPTHVFLNNKIR